jgi:hypothetical protein
MSDKSFFIRCIKCNDIVMSHYYTKIYSYLHCYEYLDKDPWGDLFSFIEKHNKCKLTIHSKNSNPRKRAILDKTLHKLHK